MVDLWWVLGETYGRLMVGLMVGLSAGFGGELAGDLWETYGRLMVDLWWDLWETYGRLMGESYGGELARVFRIL